MRFLLSEFEQHFAEPDLEKGFRLLRRIKPRLIERHGSHLGYQLGTNFVSLQRTNLEITNCHCDCLRKYCPHVAALMFSFLGDTLVNGRPGRVRRTKVFSAGGERFAAVFAGLAERWKSLQARGGNAASLNAEFYRVLRESAAQKDFAADLAVLAALSFAGRSAVTDHQARELTGAIVLRQFAAGKYTNEEEVMYLALLEMLRSNDRVASAQFSAVLPVYLLVCTNMFHLEELRNAVAKRHVKKYQCDLFDELLIARVMLLFHSARLEGGSVRLLKNSPPEHFVALARMHFAAEEFAQAWTILDQLKMIMRESLPLSYFDYLGYLIALSEAVRDTRRQLQFAEELILHSPYLSGLAVQKFLDLVPVGGKHSRVASLAAAIESSGSEGAGDKLYVLAVTSGNPGIFLAYAQRHKVKFQMLHEVMRSHGGAWGRDELDLYFNRLKESVLQTEFGESRRQMLAMAATMVNTLADSEARRYFTGVLGFIEDRPALNSLAAHWVKACALTLPSGELSV